MIIAAIDTETETFVEIHPDKRAALKSLCDEGYFFDDAPEPDLPEDDNAAEEYLREFWDSWTTCDHFALRTLEPCELGALYCAAPEMLSALKDLREAAVNVEEHAKQRHWEHLEDTIGAAGKAIAAAEGTPTAGTKAEAPTGEIWLATIIRKSWEPRMSWATSEGELIADLLEYATDVAEIEIEEAASMSQIRDALQEQANEMLYWERAK